MRLFIGLPIETTESLESALKRTKITADQRGMEIDWIPHANFHVTLNFIGNTAPEKVADIESVIREVAAICAPFSTSLRGLGAFPDDLHMRTLWVGVRNSRALRFVQRELKEALIAKGFHQEDRDYVPHLTIGKTRKSRSARDLLSPYVRTQFGEVDGSNIVLYSSVMHGARPHYEPIFSALLAGQPDEEEQEIT